MTERLKRICDELRDGKMVVLTDPSHRENEGDLILAAEKVTPEAINFMARYGRGLICLAMAPEEIDRLGLKQMAEGIENRSPFGTAFTVSIEAATGVTTGISAADRARTIQVATLASSGPKDIVVPGHIFPLRAKANGVLDRLGQTEGSVDLMSLAGLRPAAVICEILNEDGTMARARDLEVFCQYHRISLLGIEEIVEYRLSEISPRKENYASHSL